MISLIRINFLFLLISFISAQNAPPPPNAAAHVILANVQARNLQAKARLASCQHAVGVLILQGRVQIHNGTVPAEEEAQKEQSDLVAVQKELQESIVVLKKAYSEEKPGPADSPSRETILECIQLYSKAYGQVNGGADSGVGTPKEEAEITAAIGVMMRRTSQLQASIQESFE